MTTISAQRISLRSPAALCCAVPHLLGFHPQNSIVMVWLAGGSLILTQRVDLPTVSVGVDGWVSALWSHRGAELADEVIIVLCATTSVGSTDGPIGDDGLIDELAQSVRTQAERMDTHVRDLIVLCGDRWRSLLCGDSDCCPSPGRQIPADLRASVAAAFHLDGDAPLTSRAEVVASLALDPHGVASVESTGVLQRVRRMGRAARERWRDSALTNLQDWTGAIAPDSGPNRMAHLLVALRDIRVRDCLVWHLVRADADALRIAQGRLCLLLRHAPAGEVAPVATVAGLSLWLQGDGVRAVAACERALADDPSYTLAQMLAQTVGAGLSPADWRSAVETLSWEECRYGAHLQHEGQAL